MHSLIRGETEAQRIRLLFLIEQARSNTGAVGQAQILAALTNALANVEEALLVMNNADWT